MSELTAEEIAHKYVHGEHSALTDNQEKAEMVADIVLHTKAKTEELSEFKKMSIKAARKRVLIIGGLEAEKQELQKEVERLKELHPLDLFNDWEEATAENEALKEALKLVSKDIQWNPNSPTKKYIDKLLKTKEK
jgi:hypothetical protein